MKKYIIGLLTIIGLSFFINKNDEAVPVFNEQSTEYAMYILKFPNQNVSTNNLESIFKDIQIIWLEPFVNILYKERLNYKQYHFEDISQKENINRFKTNFLAKLQDNNYKLEAINLQISGIKINRMKVYSNEENIKNLKIDGMKYEKME